MTEAISNVILKDKNFDPEKYRANVPALITAIRNSSDAHPAIYAIARLRSVASAAIPALWEVVNNPHSPYRVAAAMALLVVDGPSPELFDAVLRIARMVESPGYSAFHAIKFICYEWPLTKEHYAIIRDFCKSTDRNIKTYAVMGLRRLGIMSSEIQTILDKDSPSEDNESIVINTMPWIFINEDTGNCDLKPEKYAWAVPELIGLLRERYYPDKLSVAHALSYLGPTAKEAVTALRECLTDEDTLLQIACASALIKIDGPTIGPLLVIEKELMGTQYMAAESAASAIFYIAKGLADSTDASECKKDFRVVLLRILGEMCKHTDDFIRSQGAQGLKHLGAV